MLPGTNTSYPMKLISRPTKTFLNSNNYRTKNDFSNTFVHYAFPCQVSVTTYIGVYDLKFLKEINPCVVKQWLHFVRAFPYILKSFLVACFFFFFFFIFIFVVEQFSYLIGLSEVSLPNESHWSVKSRAHFF